ncbi:MAG: response regulator [Desulfovibrionaceae bacterium]|nr:response regulator [Desulfovibrionaceae bacterium]
MQQQGGEGAYRGKSDFLAQMSHDIRTPMNSIVGLSHLCLQTELDSRQRDYLEKIQSAAVNLASIFNDMFDFARIESGRMELQPISFRITDLLQRTADTIVLRAEKKGLEILFRIPPDVPEYLEGDSHRLNQVLVNLASNALRFTKEGEIIISVEVLERKDAFLHVHFSIQDTGIGMSREQVAQLGHFFASPLENLFPEANADAGLGLALVHMLVRLMDGKIWVESETEHGSIFHISLWLKAGTAPVPHTISAELLRHLHVLVVDDNASARIILSEALTSFGFRVQNAESGLEALNMLQQACEQNDPFALVLLDWKMPGLDGVETAKRIKENPCIHAPPQLLMVSASMLEDCQLQMTDAGIHGFLLKPVARSTLFDSIVRLFAKEKNGTEHDVPGMSQETGGSGRADDLKQLTDARILLVEDNDINQQIAAELLEMAGAVVTTANNGKEALDLLLQRQFDAVLMDIQMPILDGLEAARRARELPVPGIRALPILAMTAHALETDRKKSLQAGMQDHLTKPINPELLYASLAKWIRSGTLPDAERAQPDAAPPGGLGDMPGLSVQNALRNLGGNESLYKKLLNSFVESYANAPQQVSDALDSGDQQLAVRLAHTVKGVAANLGAFSLASLAGDLEKTLAANEEHAVLLARMRDAMRQTIQSIRCLLEASQDPDAPAVPQTMNAEQQTELIAFLRAAPERMNFDWIAVQQRLKECKGLLGHSATASAYAALMQAVDDFDADAVRTQAEKIIALLQEAQD